MTKPMSSKQFTIYMIVAFGLGWIPHLKGKIRYIFFALWMPALLSIIGGVFFVFFPDAFDLEVLTLRRFFPICLRHWGKKSAGEALYIPI